MGAKQKFAMPSLDGTEIWRTIPPEEKLELMSQAHAKGIFSAFLLILVGSTLSVGFKSNWMLWGGILASPMVFQFAAGKAWRGLRPRLVLEYLAARSAARRYAFSNKGKDLTVRMMFRGTLSHMFEEDMLQEALEAAFENTKEAAVWITLFGDSVVMMSEEVGGARLQLAQVLNDKLSVESKPGASGKDYANGKEIVLSINSKTGDTKKYKVTSKHAAALVVFEKKMQSQLSELRKAGSDLEIPQLDAPAGGDDDLAIPSMEEF